jgi:CoA binding domain
VSYHDPAVIRRALSSHTWAVVGLTRHEYRAAYAVAAFLQANGMRIVPVNPLAESVHGENGYAHLSDIDFPIDVVDIFRRPDQAGQHVDEARGGCRPRCRHGRMPENRVAGLRAAPPLTGHKRHLTPRAAHSAD